MSLCALMNALCPGGKAMPVGVLYKGKALFNRQSHYVATAGETELSVRDLCGVMNLCALQCDKMVTSSYFLLFF